MAAAAPFGLFSMRSEELLRPFLRSVHRRFVQCGYLILIGQRECPLILSNTYGSLPATFGVGRQTNMLSRFP